MSKTNLISLYLRKCLGSSEETFQKGDFVEFLQNDGHKHTEIEDAFGTLRKYAQTQIAISVSDSSSVTLRSSGAKKGTRYHISISDSLKPKATKAKPETKVQHCPICGVDQRVYPSFPSYICSACLAKSTDQDGRPVRVSSASMFGREVKIRVIETGEIIGSGNFYIDRRLCTARVALSGAIIANPSNLRIMNKNDAVKAVLTKLWNGSHTVVTKNEFIKQFESLAPKQDAEILFTHVRDLAEVKKTILLASGKVHLRISGARRGRKYHLLNGNEARNFISDSNTFDTNSEDRFSVAKSRYKNLIERSFKNKLAYCWYQEVCLNGKDTIEPGVFDTFTIDDNLRLQYTSLYEDMTKVRSRNQLQKDWEATHRTRVRELMRQFTTNFQLHLDFKHFSEEFFGQNDRNRVCGYCGIDESDIKPLTITKRKYVRFRMEVDRIEPEGPYAKGNIILACPCCNNAKTDEFSKEEFQKLAEVIRTIWDERRHRTSKKSA